MDEGPPNIPPDIWRNLVARAEAHADEMFARSCPQSWRHAKVEWLHRELAKLMPQHNRSQIDTSLA